MSDIPQEVLDAMGQAGGPSAAGPIGVPEYVRNPETGEMEPYIARRTVAAPRRGGWAMGRGSNWGSTTIGVAPSFYEGDETSLLFSLPPAQLAALQSRLSAAGLLDPDSYQPGFVGGGNDPTTAAVELVMSYGNRAGFARFEDALNSYINSGFGEVGAQGYAGAQGPKRPLPSPVTNTEDLRAVFRATIIDTLGVGWSEAQINALVEDYQAHERAYNEQAVSAQMEEGAPPAEQMPSVETFAVNAATKADPTGAQAQDFLGAANSLTSMLGRWTGG